jgi:hypothetical protein
LPIDRKRRAIGSAAPEGTKQVVLVGRQDRQRDVTAVNAVGAGLGTSVGHAGY